MTMMTKIFTGGVAAAALASAVPAIAQFTVPNRGQIAVDNCTAAVQNRLNLRSAYGGPGAGRVVAVTRVNHRGSRIQVRGLATRNAFGPYGVGLYGTLGASRAAELIFRCSVDPYGRVRDLDINRR